MQLHRHFNKWLCDWSYKLDLLISIISSQNVLSCIAGDQSLSHPPLSFSLLVSVADEFKCVIISFNSIETCNLTRPWCSIFIQDNQNKIITEVKWEQGWLNQNATTRQWLFILFFLQVYSIQWKDSEDHIFVNQHITLMERLLLITSDEDKTKYQILP